MNAHATIDEAAWLYAEARDASRPDPPYTVSEWADKNRVLASVSSSEPGRWRTSRTPYLREIMDNMSAYSPVSEQAVMKGVQIGMSEAGFNFVGYAIHHAPGPLMYVMPTLDMAKKFSKTRIDPMIAESPALAERIKPARARDSGNTVFQKDFDGGTLLMTGANSAAGLRSMPIRFLVLDEVDAYPASADDEGDPVMLAVQRTATFIRRKIFMLSTPGLKENSRIGKAFREGDQRYYHVACEACGYKQPITWAKIKWEEGRPETAAFVCGDVDKETGEIFGCGHRHEEHRKGVLLREKGFGGAAEWIPTATPKRAALRSYHVSALYSPWFTWAEAVTQFLAAKDDPALLQVFVNTVLGEEWDNLGGDKLEPDSLMAKRERFSTDPLPSRAALLTCGVDVQPDRLELEVVGWGRDEESWSIDYQVFPGDPSEQEVWDQLDDYLSKRWEHEAKDRGMPIMATCVDTGGANTQAAYRFVRPREGRRIWAIKGYAGKRPVWPRKPSRNNKGRVNLFAIGVDAAKEIVTARLTKTGPDVSGAGACHFPMERDKEYFEQLTAERKVTRYAKGFKIIEWKKADHDRNEAFDCRVYAYAALQGLIIAGYVLNREASRIERALGMNKEETRPEPVAEATDAAPAPEAGSPEPESPNPAKSAIRRKKKKSRVVSSGYMS